jgi:alkanesulfonate monooxygenase SsuD/methylene tetrahydromethanopterin reductase-like flavin-dependent oxidoreductase (luciferase family)
MSSTMPSGAIDYGVFLLLPRADPTRPVRQVIDDGLEQAVTAEQLGFDTVWLAEHHFSNYGTIPNPLHFAVKVADRTRSIRIGTAVLVIPFYHALRLAEDIALVDILTGGRLVVGVGRGYQKYEFDRFDRSLNDSRTLFNENMEIVYRALTQPSFSFSGAHYDIPETSLQLRPLQQPHPEIWVAASSQDSIDWTVDHDCALIISAGINPLDLARKVRATYNASLRRAGRSAADARFGLQRYVYVTDDPADARSAVEQALYTARIADRYRSATERITNGIAEAAPLPSEPSPDELLERLIVGAPEVCIEKLQQDVDTFRPTHLTFFAGFGSLSQDRILRSMRRLAENVLPHIRPATAPAASAAS